MKREAKKLEPGHVALIIESPSSILSFSIFRIQRETQDALGCFGPMDTRPLSRGSASYLKTCDGGIPGQPGQ